MARVKRKIAFFRISPENDDDRFRLDIFDVLKKERDLSISGILEKTGKPGRAVDEYVNSCAGKGLLKISRSDRGDMVEFNVGSKKVLGVGFVGEESVLTAMDLGGNITAAEKIGIGPFLKLKGRNKDIKDIVDKIGEGTRLRETDLYSAGIAVPEWMNKKNPKSADILGEGISRLFNCDVRIAREATAAGYGEKEYGAQARGKDVLYIHSDVGAGVVIKNEMIFEAEEEGGEDKAYLRPWEQFSIVNTAKGLVERGRGTSIVHMLHGDVDNMTLEAVLGAAEDHDELAEDVIERSGLALGVRVSYLANTFGADTVIVGIGAEKHKEIFVRSVKESTTRFLFKDLADRLEIVSGALGKEASSIGAASLCRRNLFTEC